MSKDEMVVRGTLNSWCDRCDEVKVFESEVWQSANWEDFVDALGHRKYTLLTTTKS